jgi:hypothetical protein
MEFTIKTVINKQKLMPRNSTGFAPSCHGMSKKIYYNGCRRWTTYLTTRH